MTESANQAECKGEEAQMQDDAARLGGEEMSGRNGTKQRRCDDAGWRMRVGWPGLYWAVL